MIGQFKRLFSATGNGAPEEKTDTPVDTHRPEAAQDTPVLPLAGIEDEYCSYLLGVNSPLDIPLNGFETQVLDGVEGLLASADTVCDSLPRLPDVLPKLMKALRDERASWEEIAQVVGQDALLVAEVLRLANSPCFRAAAKITCLEQVVMQLGLVGLREVVITVSLKPIMKLGGGHYYQHVGRKVWPQALSVAVACRSLALSLNGSRFEAYIAGLVHNVGMVLVVQTLQAISQGTEAPRSIQFRNQIQQSAKRLTCLIARQWDLPAASVEALQDQVDPTAGRMSPLGRILQYGTHLSMLQSLAREGRVEDIEPYLLSLPDSDRSACERALSEIEAYGQSF